MKKIIFIFLIFLLPLDLSAKDLVPWKSKNNIELLHNCSGKNKFFLSVVLNNFNNGLVFTAATDSDIKSANNLNSMIYRNPDFNSKTSFIFFKIEPLSITKHTFDINFEKENAKIISNKMEGTFLEEYSEFKTLNSKNANIYLKNLDKYSKKIYKKFSELEAFPKDLTLNPISNLNFSCNMVGAYKLN